MVFNHILLVAADTPDRLRACDVYRVMCEAFEQGKFTEFKAWLLEQDLMSKTRSAVEQFSEDDCK